MIKKLKRWLPLMIIFLSLLAVVSLDVMAEEVNVNDITTVPTEKLPVEPVGEIEVKTIETKTADGLLVQETSVPKSQLIYALSEKGESIIQTNALDAGLEDEIMSKMKESLVRLDSEVNLSEYQIPYVDQGESSLTLVSKLYYKVLNDNPDLFYMAAKITTYYNRDQLVEKVSFTYMCNDNEIKGQMNEEEALEIMWDVDAYNTAIANFIDTANIKETMTTEEKVLAVHDTMCNWADYDDRLGVYDVPDDSYSSFGILVNRVGVCSGYSQAFGAICDRIGVEWTLVGSPIMCHEWNMVKIDDDWYHIDVTWNDDTDGYYSNNISRDYFLKSDANFSRHSDWKKSDTPEATNDKYETLFKQQYQARYYNSGKWYYDGYYGFCSSNFDGSNVEYFKNNEGLRNCANYAVIGGKIYYEKRILRDTPKDNNYERELYVCNLDGTNESFFQTVSFNEKDRIAYLCSVNNNVVCYLTGPDYSLRTEENFFKSYKKIEYKVTSSKITVSSFSADKRTGQFVDTKINLSVTAKGGESPLQYRFYYKNDTDEESMIQDYSSSNTAVFCPKNAGYYNLYVDVKSSDGQIECAVIDNFKVIDSTSAVIPHYATHVENIGWQDWVTDGEMSGTEGRGLRLEGIKIELSNNDRLGISYSTHVQNIGWQAPVSNGTMSGTEGRGYRLEAIKINLTGENANKFDIYYRVHAQNVGWMGWASNGAEAGTAGLSYRLEGIEIKIVNKGAAAPGSTENAFQDANKNGKYTAEDYSVIPHKWFNNGWYGRSDALFLMDAGDESIALRINKNDYTDIDMVTYNVISNPVSYSMIIYAGDVKFFEAGDIYRTDRDTAVVNKLKGAWSPSDIHVEGVKIVFSMTYKTGVVDTVEYRLNPERINDLGHTV